MFGKWRPRDIASRQFRSIQARRLHHDEQECPKGSIAEPPFTVR